MPKSNPEPNRLFWQARRRQNLTRGQLAEQANTEPVMSTCEHEPMTENYIGRIEQGRIGGNMCSQRLAALCARLDVKDPADIGLAAARRYPTSSAPTRSHRTGVSGAERSVEATAGSESVNPREETPPSTNLGDRLRRLQDQRGVSLTAASVAEARTDLGRELRTRREAAGLTQTALAECVKYSRSTVANVEVGRRCARRFWEVADQVLGAAGALLGWVEQVDALEEALRTQAMRARERDRMQRYAPPVAPDGCGCQVVVAWWTGRESRALRGALRMSVRAFAEYLGMSTASVAAWEDNDPTPLRLATQAVLDQALKLADADVKARFSLILATASPGRGVAGGSTVTSLHGRQRTRTAS